MGPLVVLVHGSLSSAMEWEPYQDLLAGAVVEAVDLPGHGNRVEEPFTTDAALAVISEAISRRSPNQPVMLVGHSLGGYMASVYAARHRDQLSALVLIGASGNPRGRLAAIYRGYAWLVERINHKHLARVRDTFAQALGLKPEQLPAPAAYASLPASWQAVIDDCPPELMASVNCPVLFINGQFDQMRVNEKQYLGHTSDGELTIIPRASHLAPLTHASQVAEAIQRFADRIAVR